MAVSFGLLHTFRVGSVCMTVCINVERLYAIVFPLRYRVQFAGPGGTKIQTIFTGYCTNERTGNL